MNFEVFVMRLYLDRFGLQEQLQNLRQTFTIQHNLIFRSPCGSQWLPSVAMRSVACPCTTSCFIPHFSEIINSGTDFSARQTLRPNRPPVEWIVWALSPTRGRQNCEADLLTPSTVDLKNAWNSTSIRPYAVMVEGVNFEFFHGPNACVCVYPILNTRILLHMDKPLIAAQSRSKEANNPSASEEVNRNIGKRNLIVVQPLDRVLSQSSPHCLFLCGRLLGAFAFCQNQLITSSYLSVWPSVHVEQLGTRWTNF